MGDATGIFGFPTGWNAIGEVHDQNGVVAQTGFRHGQRFDLAQGGAYTVQRNLCSQGGGQYQRKKCKKESHCLQITLLTKGRKKPRSGLYLKRGFSQYQTVPYRARAYLLATIICRERRS